MESKFINNCWHSKAEGKKRPFQQLQTCQILISLLRDAEWRSVEHTQRSQPPAESTGYCKQQSEPYLVDGLPHEVLLHGDVVANELLHGAAQQTVVEELVQVFLMLCRIHKRTISRDQVPESSSISCSCCLSHRHPTDTHLKSPPWRGGLNYGAEIAELTFAGEKNDFQSSLEY